MPLKKLLTVIRKNCLPCDEKTHYCAAVNSSYRVHLNGDAHLKATLIGSSESFEVDKGNLGVGETGYIYFADFDRTRERTRKCKIVIIGE